MSYYKTYFFGTVCLRVIGIERNRLEMLLSCVMNLYYNLISMIKLGTYF